MPYKKISGIYKITNIITNKVYIGSSYSVNGRMSTHRNLLLKNKHYNSHLQSSFNKHGIKNFTFHLIEECIIDDLIKRENFWILKFNANNRLFGYNVRFDCESNRGITVSKTTREKLRLSHLGHKRSKEANLKIIESQYVKVMQFDKNGKKIEEFDSILAAEHKTKIYRQSISTVCRKINKSAGGFYWCYSKDFHTFVIPKDLRCK